MSKAEKKKTTMVWIRGPEAIKVHETQHKFAQTNGILLYSEVWLVFSPSCKQRQRKGVPPGTSSLMPKDHLKAWSHRVITRRGSALQRKVFGLSVNLLQVLILGRGSAVLIRNTMEHQCACNIR